MYTLGGGNYLATAAADASLRITAAQVAFASGLFEDEGRARAANLAARRGSSLGSSPLAGDTKR